jgi:adenylate cyclase class 2
MGREIEIKFPVESEEKLVARLLALGAQKMSEGLEHNIVFDNGDIRKRGILLRLRKTPSGKNVLTIKTTIRKGEFKEADETEIEVSDFAKAKEILAALGYEIWWIYEKEKTRYVLGGTAIDIDRLPFGKFMEIEGSETGIRSAIAKLGLDPKKGIKETYLELYQKYCKDKGIDEMENLVFWKKARRNLV